MFSVVAVHLILGRRAYPIMHWADTIPNSPEKKQLLMSRFSRRDAEN